MKIEQGGIYDAYLDPTVANEQNRNRPVIVISGNSINAAAPVVIVCPLTSTIKEYFGGVILMPKKQNGLKNKSEVLVSHVRSIAKKRLKKNLGKVSSKELLQIIFGLNQLLRY